MSFIAIFKLSLYCNELLQKLSQGVKVMSTETLNTTYGITSAALLPIAESTNPYGLSSAAMTESVGDSTSLDPLLPLATKVNFSYQPLTSYTMDTSTASSQVSDSGSTLRLSNTASK